jgi:hypothetical protein
MLQAGATIEDPLLMAVLLDDAATVRALAVDFPRKPGTTNFLF